MDAGIGAGVRMSDNTGWIELEPDEPVAAPEPPASPTPEPEPQAAAAEPEPIVEDAPAQDDDEPDDALTSGDGRKYVPLSALQEAREKNKTLKQQLEQPRALSAEEQRQIESARYLASQLQNRPDILHALRTGETLTREQQRTVDRVEATAPQPVQPPTAEFDESELREVAELQGYYDANGQPNLDAAKKYLGILDRRAAKLADARVAPLIQQHALTESEKQIEKIVGMAADMGVSPEEARPILHELAKANPAMMIESPEYGLAGVIFAAGVKSLQRGKAPAAPAPQTAAPVAPVAKPEPLLVERSIGPARTQPVSAAERARAKHYGINPKAYERAEGLIKSSNGGIIQFEE
jgi:hypothetical protein